MTFNRRIEDRQKRGTFRFKTLFDLSRYDFRLPRYRRVKGRVIFNHLPSPSLSLTRTSRSRLVSLTCPKSQTSDRRISQKERVVRNSRKKYRSLDRGPIHNFSSAIEIINPCISATDRDIGMKQKVISMAWFPPFPEWILIDKFSVFFSAFHVRD